MNLSDFAFNNYYLLCLIAIKAISIYLLLDFLLTLRYLIFLLKSSNSHATNIFSISIYFHHHTIMC